MEMGLAVPLTMLQIEAAKRLHWELWEWQVTYGAFRRPLSARFTYPGSDADEKNPNDL